MKTSILTLIALSFLSLSAQAGTRQDLVKVRALAERLVSGSDVRKTVSVYDNTNGQNPCASEGVNYIVKVELRKSVMKMMPNGEVGQEREWQEFNQYGITKESLDAGGELDDGLCQE